MGWVWAVEGGGDGRMDEQNRKAMDSWGEVGTSKLNYGSLGKEMLI